MATAMHEPDELDAALSFPSEFPYEFDSFGLEPLESSSVACSTETESNEEELEDFFTGLTRRLSQATIHETRNELTVPISNRNTAESQKKTWGLAGSPQSTLSGLGIWSGRSSESGEGSPNGSSTVPSPTATPFSSANDAWDVINAAAGQVARLKMSSEVSKLDFQSRVLGGLPRAAPTTLPAGNPTASLLANLNLVHTLNHVSQVQLQQMKQDQMVKKQCASIWGMAQSAWPPLQVKAQNRQFQHLGSGSGPVLSCGSGSGPVLSSGSGGVKRGCGGTGVFLPRPYGAPPEPRKKSAKVVAVAAPNQPRFSSPFVADYDALLARRNAVLMQQKLSFRREEATNYEIRLPQEWSY